jgi:hypothetical protein
MNPRSARALVVALAVAAFVPRRAEAMGAVVSRPDESASIADVRLAVAVSPERTTRWAQITLSSYPAGGFAWLVPLEPGARVDLASDAWIDALDAATAPVVVPIDVPLGCDVSQDPQVVAAESSPSPANPVGAVVALDFSSLSSFVGSAGFEMGDGLQGDLQRVFDSGLSILALVYGSGGSSMASTPVRAIRIVDTGPATLPLALTASGATALSATAFVLAGSEEEVSTSPLVFDPGSLVWLPSGESNFTSAVASLLEGSGGVRWFNESAGPEVFQTPTTVTPSLALPSVLSGYYALASKYGDTTADANACVAAAQGTEGGDAAYGALCPAGALATAPGPSPCNSASQDESSATPLLCGNAVDAALAVAGLLPSSVWVTRATGVVTAGTADLPLLSDGTVVLSAIATASCAGACDGSSGWGGEGETDAGAYGDDGGGSGALGGDDGGLGYYGGDGGALGDLAATSGDSGVDISDSCGSGSESDSSDGCGGGSSGGDDDSDACSGQSSSSSDSDGCSGNNDCSTARHAHRTRSPVSRVGLTVAALAGLARRRRRRASIAVVRSPGA